MCSYTVCLCVSLLGGSGFWSSRGGAVHDEAVSSVGADPLCSWAEKQQLLLDGNQTTATTLLHRWSETSYLSGAPTLAQYIYGCTYGSC